MTVAVVGDGILDVYHYGHAPRLCPEAPVPVFVEDSTDAVPGGAANVVRNLEALGMVAIDCLPDVTDWSEKHRYMVDGHLVLRIDRDKQAIRREPVELPQCEVLILSDYGKGWLDPPSCRALIRRARDAGVPVLVDPKSAWAAYRGCTLILPNEREAQSMPPGMFPNVLRKLGPRGLCLELDGAEPFAVPAAARSVFDVTGAGDTVIATLAAALAAGYSMRTAVIMANLAAGDVVEQLGTAVPRVGLAELARRAEDWLT